VNWLLRRRFLVLLLALALLLIVYPAVHEEAGERLLFDALVTVVFLAAMLVVFKQPHHRLLALVLGVPTVVGVWTGYVFPGLPPKALAAAFHLVAAVFLVFAIATLLREIHNDEKVSADSIYGAFCGYLLLGLIFGNLYGLVEWLKPGSFSGGDNITSQLQNHEQRHFLLVYFSFVTLTSVGYGDITPASDAARGLAVVEALCGQFYLAVLIGELIGKRVSQVLADNQSGSPRKQIAASGEVQGPP
jgi:voltage-gated potassium channel